jgi:hypothetical protein
MYCHTIRSTTKNTKKIQMAVKEFRTLMIFNCKLEQKSLLVVNQILQLF